MSVAEVFGVGGPFAAVAIIIGYYLRYLIQRRSSERTSESGIVETTNSTLKLVRENQEIMARELRNLREENIDLHKRLRLKDEQFDKINDRNIDLAGHVEKLESENRELRLRLDAIEASTDPGGQSNHA